MAKIKVKACTDIVVRNPETGEALPKGKEVTVPDTRWWRERVREGTCKLVGAKPEAAPAKDAKPSK